MMQDIRDALDPVPLAAPSNIHWPFLVACALAAAVAAAVALTAVWMVRRRVQRRRSRVRGAVTTWVRFPNR